MSILFGKKKKKPPTKNVCYNILMVKLSVPFFQLTLKNELHWDANEPLILIILLWKREGIGKVSK